MTGSGQQVILLQVYTGAPCSWRCRWQICIRRQEWCFALILSLDAQMHISAHCVSGSTAVSWVCKARSADCRVPARDAPLRMHSVHLRLRLRLRLRQLPLPPCPRRRRTLNGAGWLHALRRVARLFWRATAGIVRDPCARPTRAWQSNQSTVEKAQLRPLRAAPRFRRGRVNFFFGCVFWRSIS